MFRSEKLASVQVSLFEQICFSFVTSEPYPYKRGPKRYRHPPRDCHCQSYHHSQQGCGDELAVPSPDGGSCFDSRLQNTTGENIICKT